MASSLGIKEASIRTGISYHTLYGRIARGMSLAEAVAYKNESTAITYNNKEYASLKALASAFNINYNTLVERLRDGMKLKEALETPVRKRKAPVKKEPQEDVETKVIEFDGKPYNSMSSLARAYGMQVQTLNQRIKSGMPLALALTMPVDSKARGITYNGTNYPSLKKLATEYGLNVNTLNKRLSSGMSLDEALALPVDTKKSRINKSA